MNMKGKAGLPVACFIPSNLPKDATGQELNDELPDDEAIVLIGSDLLKLLLDDGSTLRDLFFLVRIDTFIFRDREFFAED